MLSGLQRRACGSGRPAVRGPTPANAAAAWDALDQSSLSANLGATLRWSLDTRRHGQLRPSARLEWWLSERWMFSLGYRAMYGDASSSQGGQLGLKYGW